MVSFPASKLESEPPNSATTGIPNSTRRAGISGLCSSRRPWTFLQNQPASESCQGSLPWLLWGVHLCQPTKAFFTFSPLSSRWFACIYITKGEFSSDSFLNKESLFQGFHLCLLKPRRRGQFLAFPNVYVWLAVNTISTLLAVFFFFYFWTELTFLATSTSLSLFARIFHGGT